MRASENNHRNHSITATIARPDIIVIQDNLPINPITLLKLTVPANTPEGLQEALRRKHLKTNYVVLLTDLEVLGVSSALDTTEIGTLLISSPISQLLPCMPSSPRYRRAKSTVSFWN